MSRAMSEGERHEGGVLGGGRAACEETAGVQDVAWWWSGYVCTV